MKRFHTKSEFCVVFVLFPWILTFSHGKALLVVWWNSFHQRGQFSGWISFLDDILVRHWLAVIWTWLFTLSADSYKLLIVIFYELCSCYVRFYWYDSWLDFSLRQSWQLQRPGLSSQWRYWLSLWILCVSILTGHDLSLYLCLFWFVCSHKPDSTEIPFNTSRWCHIPRDPIHQFF